MPSVRWYRTLVSGIVAPTPYPARRPNAALTESAMCHNSTLLSWTQRVSIESAQCVPYVNVYNKLIENQSLYAFRLWFTSYTNSKKREVRGCMTNHECKERVNRDTVSGILTAMKRFTYSWYYQTYELQL